MAQYLSLPGLTGQNVRTPTTTALDVTNDLDIMVRVNADTVVGSANRGLIGRQQSASTFALVYKLALTTTDLLVLDWTTAADVDVQATATTTAGVTSGLHWLRATLDVDNGAGAYEVKFYYSTTDTSDPDSVSWTQIGTTVTGGATTDIIDGRSSLLEIGAVNSGAATFWPFNVYRGVVRDGIGGTIIADFNADDFAIGDSDTDTAVDSTGKTWTLFGAKTLIGTVDFDAATESGTWSTTPDPFTFSHTPRNTPTWALLFVVQNTASTDDIDGVPTYGGVSMPRIGSVAAHNPGNEPGRVYAFFTDAPGTGTQTVSIPHTAAANTRIATVITGTGDTPAVSVRQGTTGFGNLVGQLSQRLVTLAGAQRYVVLFSGANAPSGLTRLTGMTPLSDHDYTNQSALVAMESVASTDFTIGYTNIDDDFAQFAVAIEEGPVTEVPVLYRYSFPTSTTAHLCELMPSEADGLFLASAAFSVNGTETIATPTDWTRFDNDTSSATMLSGMFWLEADGSDVSADFVTSTATNATGGVHIWYIPPGLRDETQDPENTTVGPTASGTPDPGSLTPSWGSAANHWFVVLRRDAADGISSLGANYVARFQYDPFAGAEAASSWYINTATSEDPPSSTVATTDEEFKAYTLAVKPPGDDSVTGTGSSTLEDATSAGSGLVANPVTGTGTSTLGGVTSAGTGTESMLGAGASTLDGVTSAGSGIVAAPVTGTGSSILDGVTSAGSGNVIAPVTGTGSTTLDGVTSAGTGNVIQPVSGSGSSTLQGVTSAGTGTLGMVGVGGSLLDGVVSQGSGLVANPVTGTGTSTLDGVTSTGTGSTLAAGHIENVVCDLLAPIGICDDLAPVGVCDSYGPVCVGTMTP